MAAQNKLNASLKNIKNKVYVNPNFNRPQKNIFLNNATMHVNPKFSRFVSNDQINVNNKNKIYINPNFIKSRNVDEGDQFTTTFVNNQVTSGKKSPMNNAAYKHQLVDKEAALPVPVAQSRYCLVRQNVTNKPLNDTLLEKGNNSFKISKYKTVSWKAIKRNLNNVKNVTNTNLTHSETNVHTPFIENVSSSLRRIKLINNYNYNYSPPLKQDKIKAKISSEPHKKVFKSNQVIQLRVKKMKGNLKKNNIPCPLFRKFGKCIRHARDSCEFLHDKKHVSICRKFIKGLCHDKDCLLSHDLTTKKMPTCYFYLQGTCTKTKCPYLHVKLNEKTKICPDFVTGYCEKGSKCLQRHINLSTERKNQISKGKNSFRKKYSSFKNEEGYQKVEKTSENSAISFLVKDENYSENRYYDEHKDEGSTNEYEIIKPMRCKLGTLPSFIQL